MTLELFLLLSVICCILFALLLRRLVWWRFILLLLLIAFISPNILYFINISGGNIQYGDDLWEIFIRSAVLLGFSAAITIRMTFWLFARYKVFRQKIKDSR